MKFTTEVKVLGMKSSKGQMDGITFDSTKAYIETPLDDSKDTAKGSAVAEYNMGTSEEFKKYKHLSFPFIAEATLEIVSTGKAQRTIVTELKPRELANLKKAA